MNVALDRKLAAGIFHCISHSKPGGAQPLERLELRVHGGCHPDSLFDLFEHIGQWWLIDRSPRDDSRDVMVLKELPRRQNPDWKPKGRLRQEMGEIFRRVWPKEPGSSGDSREEWHSWPWSEGDN